MPGDRVMKTKADTSLLPCTERRILVVDDEKSIRDMFHRVLSCGVFDLPQLKVDLAVDGAEGVESFRTVHQAVILMDLQMPVMDGEQAFREMCDICRECRWEKPCFIFFTGYDPPPGIIKLVEDNNQYNLLRKPVARDALISALKEHLHF